MLSLAFGWRQKKTPAQDLPGFANWMRVQALEEGTHGEKLFRFSCEAGGRAFLLPIEGPKNDFTSPLEVFEYGLEHEKFVTASINKLMDLAREEGNIDHVVPRSKGGPTSWSNCVLSCKRVNNRKGDRTPHEAGLHLMKSPEPPKVLPMTLFLQNVHDIPEWEPFLIRKNAYAGS